MALYHRANQKAAHRLESPPDNLAYRAIYYARCAIDAITSRSNRQADFNDFLLQPVHQKIINASTPLVISTSTSTLAYLVVGLVEWLISQEIYEVMLPVTGLPFLIFLTFLYGAFHASKCFGESLKTFNLGLAETPDNSEAEMHSMINQQYGQSISPSVKEPQGNWYYRPVFGLVLSVILLGATYWLSAYRVSLETGAGQASQHTLYLPTALMAFEIIIGIPAYFFVQWLWLFFRQKGFNAELTKLQFQENRFRQNAIESWLTYHEQIGRFNQRAREHGRSEHIPVPENEAIRRLLDDEFPQRQQGGDSATTPPPDPEPPDDDDAPVNGFSDFHGNGNNHHGETNEDRIDNLKSVLDDQIELNNQSF